MKIQKKSVYEVMRFGIIGGLCTGIHYILYLMLQYLGITYNIAYTLGYGMSFIFNFFASTYFTFKVTPNVKKGSKFVIAHLGNYIIQMALLNISAIIGIPLSVAPILVFIISVPINFLFVKKALKQ